ncbi:MAG: hypothetical protein K1X67_23555 [Fimbriimonadaceae bacterium]|nr:hypothetical protein [Fimbriimonadaceae bacterium]
MMKVGKFFSTTLFFAGFVVSSHAAIIKVKPGGNDGNSGATWAQAKATLQGALFAAAPGDELWVASGTYAGGLSIGFDVKIYGGFAGTETVLDNRNPNLNPTTVTGSNTVQCFQLGTGRTRNMVIDGFIITNGFSQFGGGIGFGDGSPTISNNTFFNNRAEFAGDFDSASGGAIDAYSGSPLIQGNQFINNSCAYNGIGFSFGVSGGAINMYEGSPVIVANVFRNNFAEDESDFGYASGGAIYQYTGTPLLYNNIFAGNQATSEGGAVAFYENQPVVVNNTFSSNAAVSGIGGAFYTYEGNPTFANNIVANCETGAVFILIFGGTANNNCLYSNGFYDYAGFTPGGNDVSGNPSFVDAGTGNYRLQSISICRNAGANGFLPLNPLNDVYGNARISEGAVDIGAAEYTLSMVSISGLVTLEDFLGAVSSVSASYEIIQGGNVVDSGPLTVGSGGQYAIQTAVLGNSDILIKASHWLRRAQINVNIVPGGVSGLNFSLTNGDSDGDNEVGIGDYAVLSSAYNSSNGDPNWDATADLNGDDAVDIADYAILSANYGLTGD